MSWQLCNYHTHTSRCLHAVGTDEEYVKTACQNGYRVLGFTDHMAWPYENGFVSSIRMPVGELENYAACIHALAQKYENEITVRMGAECEFFPEYMPWLLEQKQKLGMEYLILGVHCAPCEKGCVPFAESTMPEQLQAYTELAVSGMESGAFACLCHPDLPLKTYPRFDRYAREMSETICAAARRLELPLEYNLAGIRLRGAVAGGYGYTSDAFWEIAAGAGCTAVIASDAHDPNVLKDTQAFSIARKKLRALGMPVLDTLPGLGAKK